MSVKFYLLFFCTLCFLIGYLIWKRSDIKERKFIVGIFIFGLIIRILLGVGMHIGLKSMGRQEGALFNDDGGWPKFGYEIVQYYKGEVDSIYDPYGERNIFADFLGILYYLFGCSPLLSKLVNMVLSVSTGIVIFYIARACFNTKIAKISASVFMFWPSIILWSVLNLKDTMTIFFIASVILSAILFLKKNNPGYLFFLCLFLAGLFSIRLPVALLLSFSLFVVFFICLKRRFWVKLIWLIGLFIVVKFFFGAQIEKFMTLKFHIFGFDINNLLSVHQGFYNTGGAVYKVYDDIFYQMPKLRMSYFSLSFMRAVVRGFFNFMYSPFPWQISSRMLAIYLPFSLFWLLLTPLTLKGIFMIKRYGRMACFVVLAYLAIVTYAFSLSSANIGTAARHRDMLVPFYLIFTSAGFYSLLSKRKMREK